MADRRLREISCRAEIARADGLATATGETLAPIRPLPPPFNRFLAITSDCDGGRLDRYFAAADYLREHLRLPIADSIFCDAVADMLEEWSADTAGETPIKRDAARISALFHAGAVDVAHGWIRRMLVQPGRARIDLSTSGASNWLRRGADIARQRIFRTNSKTAPLSIDRWERTNFQIPEGWQDKEPPRYLCFTVESPRRGTCIEIKVSLQDRTLYTDQFDLGGLGSQIEPIPFIVDLKSCDVANRVDLQGIEVGFRLVGPGLKSLSDTATAVVRDAVLLSADRSDILKQAAILASAGIQPPTFTSHGIGLLFGTGGMPTDEGCNPMCLADRPENSHYSIDVLKNAGIDFFNTFQNTCILSAVAIDGVVREFPSADGTFIYDFNRYSYAPKPDGTTPDFSIYQDPSGNAGNPSHSEHVGKILRGLREECGKRTFHGGLVYTHLIVGKNWNDWTGDAASCFNQETQAEFEILADDFLDPEDCVPAENRCFVAATSVLVRMSQAHRLLSGRFRIDEKNDEILLESTVDPVLGRRFPSAENMFRDIRWITVEIPASGCPRMFVDGQEIPWLVRFPPAEDAKTSHVAIADISCPVHLSKNLNASPTVGSNEIFTASGFASDFPVSGVTSVLLSVEGARPTGVPRLRLSMTSGESIETDAYDFGPVYTGDAEGFARSSTSVTPIWAFRGRLAPQSRVASVEILWPDSGPAEGTSRVMLLQDSESPIGDEGCFIGGCVEQPESTVQMRLDGKTYQAAVNKEGQFLFNRNVPRNTHVEIRVGHNHPDAGSGWTPMYVTRSRADLILSPLER